MHNPENPDSQIGKPLPRREDIRLIQGRGRYTDDFRMEGELHAVFVRSPYPSARIISIDTATAAEMTGVRDILTAETYRAEGGLPIRHIADPLDAIDVTKKAFGGFPDTISIDIPQPPLAEDAVRYVGEPVAMVVAETLAQAIDAAEAVFVEYEELPFLSDAFAALAEGAPLVDPRIAGNLCTRATFGDRAATDAAMARAAHVVSGRFPNQRVANAQMEPRAAIAWFDPDTSIHHMIAGNQGAARQRDGLAWALDVAKDKVRVITPDVGGGFGPRTMVQSEQPLLLIAARRLGRPVRWTSTRNEAFLTDFQGRELCFDAKLGLDADGRILAYEAEITGNIGAYTVSFVPLSNSYRIMCSVYDIPAAVAEIRGALTHTVPTGPFRGAGRPEAIYAIERLLDMAAAKLGLSRDDIRRRNLISPAQFPYRTQTGLNYDSGDFAGNMDKVLAAADWDGFPARRAAAAARGMLAGIGLANYIESPVGAAREAITLTIDPATRSVIMTAGTQSTGQGHETAYAQVLADRLGIAPSELRLVTGDTAKVGEGGGTHSDRSMRLVGELLFDATDILRSRAADLLAAHFGGDAKDVTFDGTFHHLGQSHDIFAVALLALDPQTPENLRGPLSASADLSHRLPAHPTGAAICELEIDPALGEVTLTRYTTVDDVGQVVNPLIVDGQTHGGIFQGVGQALSEAVASDPDSGQIITGTFMDYGVLRADRLPFFDLTLVEDPTPLSRLRIKGGGESGVTPALATVINAVVDALSPYGVTHIDMPATPAKIWHAIQAAKRTA